MYANFAIYTRGSFYEHVSVWIFTTHRSFRVGDKENMLNILTYAKFIFNYF